MASKQTDKEADRGSLFPINSRRTTETSDRKFHLSNAAEGERRRERESANTANRDTFYRIQGILQVESGTTVIKNDLLRKGSA